MGRYSGPFRSIINSPYIVRTTNPHIQMLNMFLNIIKCGPIFNQFDNFCGFFNDVDYIHKFIKTPTTQLLSMIHEAHELINNEIGISFLEKRDVATIKLEKIHAMNTNASIQNIHNFLSETKSRIRYNHNDSLVVRLKE